MNAKRSVMAKTVVRGQMQSFPSRTSWAIPSPLPLRRLRGTCVTTWRPPCWPHPPTPAPVAAEVEGTTSLVVNVVGSVLDYSSFNYSGILDGSSKPSYYDAAEVNANEGDNNVLTELTAGYQALADELMAESRRGLRTSIHARMLQALNTVTAADVGKLTDIVH